MLLFLTTNNVINNNTIKKKNDRLYSCNVALMTKKVCRKHFIGEN